MVRDIEVDKIVREIIPDILERLRVLEEYCNKPMPATIVEEKDGIYEYGVLPDKPITGSI